MAVPSQLSGRAVAELFTQVSTLLWPWCHTGSCVTVEEKEALAPLWWVGGRGVGTAVSFLTAFMDRWTLSPFGEFPQHKFLTLGLNSAV